MARVILAHAHVHRRAMIDRHVIEQLMTLPAASRPGPHDADSVTERRPPRYRSPPNKRCARFAVDIMRHAMRSKKNIQGIPSPGICLARPVFYAGPSLC